MNSKYLRIVITSALALHGIGVMDACAQTQQPPLPKIEVFGPRPGPIYLGPLGPGYWSTGDSPDADGSVSPTFGSTETKAPPVCQLLKTFNKPTDCTREVANGQEPPPEIPPQPDEFDFLIGRGYTQLSGRWDAANLAIAACYSDISENPGNCESEYETYLDVCSSVNGSDYIGLFYTDHQLCVNGMDRVRTRITNAQQDRWATQYFSFTYSISLTFSIWEFNVNFPKLDPFASNKYNQLLEYVRKFGACFSWYRLWDNFGCGNYRGYQVAQLTPQRPIA